jgi:hypothetical protein
MTAIPRAVPGRLCAVAARVWVPLWVLACCTSCPGTPSAEADDAGQVLQPGRDGGASGACGSDAGCVDVDSGVVPSQLSDGGSADGGPQDAGPPTPPIRANLAARRPVTVSAAMADAPATALVDEDGGSPWRSGAPAPGWFKVELAEPSTVEVVRLRVAQSLDGDTVHHLRLLSELGNVLFEQTLSGSTVDGQWLEVTLAAPLACVRWAQVYTQRSPAPVAFGEVEVWGWVTPSAQRWVDQPRGLRWVRTNPMFVSGLTVSLAPSAADLVNEYYDVFRANATHLWETGLPNEVAAWASAGRSDFRWVAWTLPDGKSRGNDQFAGGALPAQKGRIGFQVSDEPSGMAPLLEINQGLHLLRPYDPGALLIVNFPYDNDDIAAMLEFFCTQMDADVASYDRYTYAGSKAHVVLARFRDLGLRCRRPYWRYLKAYHDDDGDSIDASDLRWDAFSGLTYGYTGHTWFVYQANDIPSLTPAFYAAFGDLRAPKTEYWTQAAQVNIELRNLGRAVTQLTSTAVRYVPSISFLAPSGTTAWSRGAGGDPYLNKVAANALQMDLLLGFFKDDAGEIYVMVQNQRHQHGEFPNQSKDPGTLTLSFDFSAAPTNVDRTTLERLDSRTGLVKPLPLKEGSVTIELAAGDPILFKYATGARFALQQ